MEKLYPDVEALSIAEYYVCEILNLSRTELIISKNEYLSENIFSKLEENRFRLEDGEPVQYVTGNAHFYGLEFFVSKDVLIPRQETELLVDTIVKKYKNSADIKILDIGTGSGCIAISLKKFLPEAIVYAIDISQAALEVCKINAAQNNVEIETLIFDILSNEAFPVEAKFDLIISNPPYVLESEKILMHRNVVDFEPASALYVNDDNPLLFYLAITEFAISHLSNKGALFLEINEKFGNEVARLCNEKEFSDVQIVSDLDNKSRFVLSYL